MTDITPTDEQAKVIKAITAWYGDKSGPQEFYLAGYAGVGKSTIANLAIEELGTRHRVKKVRTAAFTGKAASVLRKKGVPEAQTIHSLIYRHKTDKQTGKVTFTLSEDSDAADADLILLDECSMVDEGMANDLRSFGKKTLIMGDPGQLPPVKGAGTFTSREPDVFLREIHRQSAGSPILELATLAREGKRLPLGFSKGGVSVLPLNKETQELVYSRKTQAICGLNRVRWVYTQRIRKRLGYEGDLPIAGERLICCKNNKQEGFFNGSLAELKKFAVEPATERFAEAYLVDVHIEDESSPNKGVLVDPVHFKNHFTNGTTKKIEWVKGNPRYEEFDWGYVLTCHKSQGSSWDNVTVVDDSDAFKGDKNAWLYTALTRAENELTVLLRGAA